MPLFTGSATLTGTSGTDYMFGTIMSDVTASSGNGGDFIVGDFNVNGVQIASAGNTNFALAYNLDTANMWLDFPTTDYAFVQAGGPFTTVFVEGENAFEVYSFTAGDNETISIDIDYANFDSTIALYRFDNLSDPVAINDDGESVLEDIGGLDTTESFLQYDTGASGAGLYYLVIGEYEDTDEFSTLEIGDEAVLHVSVTGHAATGTVTSTNDTLTGGSGSDAIFGGGGDDIIFGGDGFNYLDGGAGFDIISYDGWGGNVFINLGFSGSQNTRITSGLPETVINFEGVIGSGFLDMITGRFDLADSLSGMGGDDTINGRGGLDVIDGGSGNDTITLQSDSFATPALSIDGGSGTDTLEIESLTANASLDLRSLTSFESVEIVQWSAENVAVQMNADQMADVTFLDNQVSSGLSVTLEIFMDTETVLDLSAISTSGFSASNADAVIINGDSDAENIIGTSYGDTINGGAGDDLIEGGAGNDILDGGAGDNDTLSYAGLSVVGTTEGINVNLSDAVVIGFYTGVDAISNFESVLGSDFDDILTGTSGANTLSGGDGVDILRGLGGADSLLGGAGDDFIDLDTDALYNNASFDGGDGFDQIRISGDDRTQDLRTTEITNIEEIEIADMNLTVQLQLASAANLSITALAHTGNVIAVEFHTGDLTSADLSGVMVSGLTEPGDVIRLVGDSDNEVLQGSAANDEILGGAGDDTILVGLGNDLLDGGAGNDTLSFAAYDNGDNSGVSVTFSQAATTISNAGSGTDTISGFENLTGSAFDDILSGLAGADITILGGGGNDVISSAGGTNTLYGQDGDDRFELDTAVIETGTLYDGGAGTDELVLIGASGTVDLRDDSVVDIENIVFGATTSADITLALNVEQLGDFDISAQSHTGRAHTLALYMGALTTFQLTGESIAGFDEPGDSVTIFGDGDAEVIFGSDTNDIIFAEGGDDFVDGGLGDDTLDGGSGVDTLSYAAYVSGNGLDGVTLDLGVSVQTNTGAGVDTISGFENLIGSDFNDTLFGETGNNAISGGLGDDIINGGGGDDDLLGEGGDDRFMVDTADSNNGTVIDGGDGVDEIYVFGASGDQSFLNDSFTSIETLTFESDAVNSHELIIRADQMIFDTVGTSDSLTGQSNILTLTMGSTRTLDLSALSFVNFDQDGDYIQINGDGTFETITGSSARDVINSGGGRDTIFGSAGYDIVNGGDSNDILRFEVSANAYQGEYEGGNGTDELYVSGNGTVDLVGAAITGIERIEFRPVVDMLTDLYISADVINGLSIEIDGSAQDGSVQDLFVVMDSSDADIDLSALSFRDWRNGSGDQNDLITIIGDGANNTMIGSSSVDILQGGLGDDRFTFLSDHIGRFDTDSFDGGAGTDELYIRAASGTHVFDLRDAEFTSIEAINFDALEAGYTAELILTASQIMSGFAANTNLFFGGTDVYTFTIDMDAATALDISGWAISGIQLGNDSLIITGDNDAETISGSMMGEIFDASNGDDIIAAGGGDDIILAGGGADAMDGGAGEDTVDYSASSAGITIDLFDGSQGTGDAAGDTFNSIEIVLGTSGNNIFIANDDGTAFIGNGGSDRVSYENAAAGVAVNLSTGSTNGAFANGDSFDNISILEGSAFNDTFNGSIGDDRLEGEGGDDTLNGRAGADRLYGDNGNDSLNGGGDNDQLFGGNGDDTLNGSIGDDRLTGGAGADILIGGTGTRDRAEYGSAGPGLVVNMSDVSLNTGDAAGDTFASLEDLFGSNHGDSLTGNGGVNWLFGRNGNDTLNGAGGQDRLFGGDGDDVGYGGEAGDELQGGEGNDTLYGEAGADRLIGDAGSDTLYGGADNDQISGGDGDDIMFGESGDDRFFGGNGADVYNGGDGTDRADYTNAASAVGVNLVTGGFQGEAGGDSYSSIEWVFGSAFNDTIVMNDNDGGRAYGRVGDDMLVGGAGEDRLYGQGDDDTLIGNDGLDRLYGNSGNDILDGGAVNDQLFGGSGADIFVFAQGYARDTIYDFEDGVDLIDLSAFNSGQIMSALAQAKQSGASTVLDFGNGDQIVLRNTDVDDITIDDFIV